MRPPLMVMPYFDPELNSLFLEIDAAAEQLAANDRQWPVSLEGFALFARLMNAAIDRASDRGFDAVLFGIAGGMPPSGRATAVEAVKRLEPANRARAWGLLQHEREELKAARTGFEVFAVLGAASSLWHLAAEELGPGANHAYACGLIWVRLHQRHEARVFLLPKRAEEGPVS